MNQSRWVYGGVQIAGRVNQLNNTNSALNNSSMNAVQKEITVYRLWGGNAHSLGGYWTPVNPNTVANYRDHAGLPHSNTGRIDTEAIIKNTYGVIPIKPALPLDGNRGGLPKILIPKAKYQV